MAKKAKKGSSGGSKARSARPVKPASRATKAASKNKASKAKASKAKAPAKRTTSSRPKAAAARTKPRAAAARAKAAPAPAPRAYKSRQQPETLRCKSLSVAITADDVAASMKFYVDGVGFHVKQKWEKDGVLLGVELVAGACMIGLSQDDWAKGRNRTKGVGISIYTETTQGVEALAARLRSRGVAFEGPDTTEWGWRQVSLRDPDGFRLIVYEEKKS